MKNWIKLATTIASVAALSACGGGGDGGDSTPDFSGPSPEGVYGGTWSADTTTAAEMVILSDGSFWLLYGPLGAGGVAGFVQGQGVWANGGFRSNEAKDFARAPSVPTPLAGSFDMVAKTIGIGVTYPDTSAGFTGSTTIPGATYSYSTPATMATVAGTWSLLLSNGETSSVNISNVGDLGGTSIGGCQFSGKLAPNASRNVFDISLIFGATPCELAGKSISGIALAHPLTAGGTQLLMAAVDGGRTSGLAASGVR